MSLREKQLILLDNLIYLNYTVENNKNITVSDVVTELLTTPELFEKTITDPQFYYCNNMVNGMNPDQWKSVLKAIQSDDKLMKYVYFFNL